MRVNGLVLENISLVVWPLAYAKHSLRVDYPLAQTWVSCPLEMSKKKQKRQEIGPATGEAAGHRPLSETLHNLGVQVDVRLMTCKTLIGLRVCAWFFHTLL